MDELDKILNEDKQKETVPPKKEETPKEPTPEEKTKEEELKKKEEVLANINKAIEQANEELKKTRDAKKKAKTEKPAGEDEIPKIDMEDPSARAWDKHIGDKVNPLQAELDQEKAEIRTFALQEFLADKPNLAKNPEKVKELVSTYDKIRTASERTKEGVLLDMNKAYAAVFHDELLRAARQERVDKAKSDSIFADIAVSRGATTYNERPEAKKQLSAADQKIADRWDDDLRRLGYKI